MMLPSASTTTRQCSQRASVPNSRNGGDDPLHISVPLAGSEPEAPPAGGAAVFALRQGSPASGNWTFGPISGNSLVSGRGRFGNSPPLSKYTRFGLSAKMPRAPPKVNFSWPGSVLRSFGQPGTTSYGPETSSAPIAPGTAENPAVGAGAGADSAL